VGRGLDLRGAEFKDIGHRKGMPIWVLPGLITIVLALIGIVTTGWMAVRG